MNITIAKLRTVLEDSFGYLFVDEDAEDELQEIIDDIVDELSDDEEIAVQEEE